MKGLPAGRRRPSRRWTFSLRWKAGVLGGRFFAIVVLGGRFLAVCCAVANSMARRESLCKFFPAFDRDVRRFWKSSGTTTDSGVVTALAVPIVAGAPDCSEEGTRPSMF